MARGCETNGGVELGVWEGGVRPTSPAEATPPLLIPSFSSSSSHNKFSSFIPDEMGTRSFLPLFSSFGEKTTGGEEAAVQHGSNDGDGGKHQSGLSGGGDCRKVDGDRLSERKALTGGRTIAERRAARGGFNEARLNAARFRTMSPLSSPVVPLPLLTIPPGLSPTALLDSPVMLPNSVSQPSPTTGTFPGSSFTDQSPILVLTSNVSNEQLEDINASSLAFKHQTDSGNTCTSHLGNQVFSTSEIKQYVGLEDVQSQTQFQMQLLVDVDRQPEHANKESSNEVLAIRETSTYNIDKANSIGLQNPPFSVGHQAASQPIEQLSAAGDPKELFSPAGVGKPSEDGYNWRKYGQKQVKGSEYPRSYYKCTHPNCQVKKKVERSCDGQITEIIYKGTHTHPRPQPNRHSAMGSAFTINEMVETPESTSSLLNVEGSFVWGSVQLHGAPNDKSSTDWRGDGPERTPSTSGATDISEQSIVHEKHLNHPESADTPDLSSTLANDDEDDGVTQGSISVGDDVDDIGTESKRRKLESSAIEASMPSRTVREPRVIVQTASEVDILDDGYRWRKYGQKVVKGNPNPRSYYKCTNAGCSVRKHVERASDDLKSVITTYEGKHNHEVPAARNSGHGNFGSGNIGPSGMVTKPSFSLPITAGPIKLEPKLDNISPCFEANEYLRAASYIRSLTSDTKLGISPGCDMKLPPLQPMPLISLGMSAGHLEAHPLASLAPVASSFPVPIPMSTQWSTTPALSSSLGFNPRKLVGPIQPYLCQKQSEEGDTMILRPKEEQKGEALYENKLGISHLPNPPSRCNQTIR